MVFSLEGRKGPYTDDNTVSPLLGPLGRNVLERVNDGQQITWWIYVTGIKLSYHCDVIGMRPLFFIWVPTPVAALWGGNPTKIRVPKRSEGS